MPAWTRKSRQQDEVGQIYEDEQTSAELWETRRREALRILRERQGEYIDSTVLRDLVRSEIDAPALLKPLVDAGRIEQTTGPRVKFKFVR